MISCYRELIAATGQEDEPQRLLFVFCRAELPDSASAEELAAFERGEGGALTPVICVDKTPAEVADFSQLVARVAQHGSELGRCIRGGYVWPWWRAPIQRRSTAAHDHDGRKHSHGPRWQLSACRR